jgi:hypothetical protein
MTPDAASAPTRAQKQAPKRKKQTPVEARLAKLRKRSGTDRPGAQDEAWSWFKDLGQRAGSDRAAAEKDLNELFRLGKAPSGLDGPTDGILVTTTTNPAVDAAVRFITGLWMPWQGKRFDVAAARGDNRLVDSARWPSKLIWPLYGTKDAADGRLAFDFETYVEPGEQDPSTKVMVIDYSKIEANPRLVIRSIRDELVEVVPGAYLGKILFRMPRGGGYENIGFFALRTQG